MITMRVNPASLREIGRLARRFENADQLLKDRRELLRTIRHEQSNEWAEDFMSQGNGEWEETSIFQQHRRVLQGYEPTPTLLRSGATFHWFNQQNRAGRVNAASITWNFMNREGAYTVSHHTGYPLGGSYVPSRELWSLEGEDEDRIATQIEEWVAARLSLI